MKVIIREAAYDDLDRIHAWIAKDRPRSADSVIDRILASADRLGRFPYMGHFGRIPGTYEWAVPGLPYIVVYTVHGDDEVAVVAVFHGAQDREGRGEQRLAEMILAGTVKDGEKVAISAGKQGLSFNGKLVAAAA